MATTESVIYNAIIGELERRELARTVGNGHHLAQKLAAAAADALGKSPFPGAPSSEPPASPDSSWLKLANDLTRALKDADVLHLGMSAKAHATIAGVLAGEETSRKIAAILQDSPGADPARLRVRLLKKAGELEQRTDVHGVEGATNRGLMREAAELLREAAAALAPQQAPSDPTEQPAYKLTRDEDGVFYSAEDGDTE